jgi:ketosteroid isomerase-like protein
VSASESVAIVLEAFRAVEERNEDRLRELYHPELEFHWTPSLPFGRSSGPSWSEVWDSLQPTDAERRMDPRVVAATEREVVVLWHQRGVAPDGTRFEGEALGLYEVRDRKFARAQMFYFDAVAVERFLAAARPGSGLNVRNRHERVVAATPERVAALVADFEQVWPTQIVPAPRLRGDRLYEAGLMLWQEFDRPGAVRAFRVISPEGLLAEHWFEVERLADQTLLRHRVEGEAVGACEAVWREQIEPSHDLVLEALLDKVEAAVACDDAVDGGRTAV